MRNLLALFAILLIAFAVIGHYRGWYTFTREGGKVEIKVDGQKAGDDIKHGDLLPSK